MYSTACNTHPTLLKLNEHFFGFKLGHFALKYGLSPRSYSYQVFFVVKNVPLNSKSTQIKPPTLVNMHFTLKPLNASPLRFQCAFRPSNSSKQTFFNSNVYFYTTNTLKFDPLQLNVPLHLQTTQNKPSSTQIKCFSTQMRLCIQNTFK
jgi:hypothetical protein